MALPEFRDDGWLPEGHHLTNWEEIMLRFGGEPDSQRRQVLSRLLQWRDAVRKRGMGGFLILNGSFVSQKTAPGDFDCLFIYDDATEQMVKEDEEAQALTDYLRCKAEWQADIFAFPETTVRNHPAFCRLDGFDLHKSTRKPKGVVEVRI